MFFLENIYQLDEQYDTKNKFNALEKAYEWGPKKIPLGVFYEVDKPVAEDEFTFVDGTCIENQPHVRDISTIINNLR